MRREGEGRRDSGKGRERFGMKKHVRKEEKRGERESQGRKERKVEQK